MNAPPSAGPVGEPAPAKAGGYRERDFDTRLGRLNLRIPKLRQGSYFPPFLESRKTSEKALVAVIQEAWTPDRVRGRRLNPQGGRTGQGHGPVRHLEIVGVQAVRRHRRAGERLSQPTIGRRMALPLVGRHLHQAAPRRAHHFGRGDNRGGGQHRRSPREPAPDPDPGSSACTSARRKPRCFGATS